MIKKTDTKNNPFFLLQQTLSKAKAEYAKHNIDNYNAAVLSTVSFEGKPKSRVILIKNVSENGLVFFTNLTSVKADNINYNNCVSLVFYWELLHKQVRIEGKVKQISDVEADKYFASRPYNSKIAAWSSNQSSVLPNREELDRKLAYYKNKYPNENVPRPPFWSGFLIIPNYFEFWDSVDFRLHNRVSYTKSNNEFITNLLYP